MYDVTDRASFAAVETWVDDIEKVCECVWLHPVVTVCTLVQRLLLLVPAARSQNADKHVNKILIGNKCDMESSRVRVPPLCRSPLGLSGVSLSRARANTSRR